MIVHYTVSLQLDCLRTIVYQTKPPLAGQATPPNKDRRGDGSSEGLSKLSLLLISRACNNEEIANFLFWYLKLEAEVTVTR